MTKWESEKENLEQLILVENLVMKKQVEDMVVLEVILRKQHYDQVQIFRKEEPLTNVKPLIKA